MATTETFKNLKINSAKDLGCYVAANQSGSSGATPTALTLPKLTDLAYDAQKFRFWYAVLDSDTTEWRLIETTTVPTDGVVNVTRAFVSTVGDTDLVHLVLALSWDEWGQAVNNALADKFYKSRASITLVADQREYNLTDTASWLRSWNQVIAVRLRDVNDGSTKPLEIGQGVWYPYDQDGEALLQMPPVSDVTNKTLEIEARRYYSALTLDADTVTITAERLLRAACKYEALKLIYNKLGPLAKQSFGMAMVLAEKELAEEEARHQQNDVRREWRTSESRHSFDPDMRIGWSW